MRKPRQRINYNMKCRTKPKDSLIHKSYVIHFHVFCYRLGANLNLSFLVTKAMIGTQFVIQFCAHKKKKKKPVPPYQECIADTDTKEQFLPWVLLKRVPYEKVNNIPHDIYSKYNTVL